MTNPTPALALAGAALAKPRPGTAARPSLREILLAVAIAGGVTPRAMQRDSLAPLVRWPRLAFYRLARSSGYDDRDIESAAQRGQGVVALAVSRADALVRTRDKGGRRILQIEAGARKRLAQVASAPIADAEATALDATLPDIVRAVAMAAGLTVDEVTGPRRTREVVVPRWAVINLATSCGYSLGRIALALGRRDHSTVMAAQRSADLATARGGEAGARYHDLVDEARRLLAEGLPALPGSAPAGDAPGAAQAAVPTAPARPGPDMGLCDGQRARATRGGWITRRGELICRP